MSFLKTEFLKQTLERKEIENIFLKFIARECICLNITVMDIDTNIDNINNV